VLRVWLGGVVVFFWGGLGGGGGRKYCSDCSVNTLLTCMCSYVYMCDVCVWERKLVSVSVSV